jgi:stress response protein YsnF
MSTLDIDTALEWRGRTVVDRHGEKIGTFEELYLDESDRPAWAAVNTGLFGMRQTFVPLSAAQPAGDSLQLPFDKQQVKDAPNVDPDAQLSAEEEDTLFRHYGLRPEDASPGEPHSQAAGEPEAQAAAPDDEPQRAPASDDEPQRERVAASADDEPQRERVAASADDEPQREPVAASADDEQPREHADAGEGAEMVRSEEEVSVGTRRRVSGRARLKKHVVTEHVQKTVPVRRERVSVELDSPDDEAEAPAGEQQAEPEPEPDRRPETEQR